MRIKKFLETLDTVVISAKQEEYPVRNILLDIGAKWGSKISKFGFDMQELERQLIRIYESN